MYRYRAPATPTPQQRIVSQTYDRMYQRTEDGVGIVWKPGMYFLKTAQETGVLPRDAKIMSEWLDQWMLVLMLEVQVEWDERKRKAV